MRPQRTTVQRHGEGVIDGDRVDVVREDDLASALHKGGERRTWVVAGHETKKSPGVSGRGLRLDRGYALRAYASRQRRGSGGFQKKHTIERGEGQS